MSELVLEICALVLFLGAEPSEASLRFGSPFGAALLPAQGALSLGHPLLGLPVPARVLNLLAGRERGETFNTHVDPDFGDGVWIGAWRDCVAREDRVPPAGLALHGKCLRSPPNRAVELDLDLSDAGEPDTLHADKPKADVLRPYQAVVAVGALKARIAGRPTILHAPKEVLERRVHAMKRLLKHLRVDLGEFWPILLDAGKPFGLIVETDANSGVVPMVPALLNGGIVEFAAEVEPRPQLSGLRLRRVDAIFERPTHLNALLVLDVLIHGFEANASDGCREVVVRPERRKSEPKPSQAYFCRKSWLDRPFILFTPMPEGRGFRAE